MSSDHPRPTLAVVFGGAGAVEEHTTSCVSAAAVLAGIDPECYDSLAVGITQEADWVLADAAATVTGPAGVPALRAEGPAVDPRSLLCADRDRPVVVFPLVNELWHLGPSVAALCALLDVACVGADPLGSDLARDKSMTRRIAASAGIPQPRWFVADHDVDAVDAHVRDDLGGYPVFVKAARLGYSVGITKARDRAQLADGIATARALDDVVLVEEAIDGREIEMGLIGYAEPRTSVAGELIPRSEYYTFEDKTATDGAETIVPADLPTDVVDQIGELTRAICTATRCLGMARVDWFYDERGRGVLLNEVNNVPGFGPWSMFPKVWDAVGLSLARLVDELAVSALEHHRATRRAPRT